MSTLNRYIPSLALALALPLAAQEEIVEAKTQGQDVANAFYRAFYLERGEQRHQEAVGLYKKFLASAPNHRYSGKAADSLVKLLNRLGKVEEAQAASEKYAAVLKKVRAEQPPEGRRGRGGFGGGFGRGQGGRGQGGRGQGGRGGFGRGGFQRTPISEMSEDQLDNFVDRTNRFAEMLIARLEDQGEEEEAKKLEKQVDTLVKLIDEGKKQEAQEAYEKYQEAMRAAAQRAGFGRGRGGFGRGGRGGGFGRGGRRGRNLRMPEGLEAPLAQMDDETRQKKVDYLMAWAKGEIDRQRGEQAEKLKGQVAEFKKLVEQKDWKAADELVNKVMAELSGGSRRGEGRRRRGGDQGGERRRRQEGDSGRIK